MGDLSPSAGGLIPGGVTVLKNTSGVVAQTGGEPAVPGMIPGGIAPHLIPGRSSSNPERGTGGSWDDSRWCGRRDSFVYNRSPFLFIQGGVYSHQRPRGGERLDGRYIPAERLRRRFRGWHLGSDGWRFSCRAVSPISKTVGGLDRRSRAADSGGAAASIVNLVSGSVARGSSRYTIPGLSLAASPASLWGLVINFLQGSPEKGLVEGCCKAVEERPNPELLTLGWVAIKSCLGSVWAGL